MSVNTHYEIKVGSWTVIGRLHTDGAHRGSVQFNYKKGDDNTRLPGGTTIPKDVEEEVLAARDKVKAVLRARLGMEGPRRDLKRPKAKERPKAKAKVQSRARVSRPARIVAEGVAARTPAVGFIDGKYDMTVGSWTVLGRLHVGGKHKGAVQFFYKKEGSNTKLPGGTTLPRDVEREVLAAKAKVKAILRARLGMAASGSREVVMKPVMKPVRGAKGLLKAAKRLMRASSARKAGRPMKVMKAMKGMR